MNALDQIATELDRLHRQHAAEIHALVERQASERAALVAQLGAPASPMSGLKRATEVASTLRRDKSTVTAWCRSNQMSGDDGFSVKIGGRWFISMSRLKAHMAARDRAFHAFE